MAKISLLILMVMISVGFVTADLYGAEQMATSVGRPFEVSEMVDTQVKNQQGEYLGWIDDFVVDSQGRVAFLVVAHSGFLGINKKTTAVPFASLAYNREKHLFVLDISKERLDAAPMFSIRDLYNEKWADEMYRYFGQQPYWTEGELVEKGVKPPEVRRFPRSSPYPDFP